MTFAPADFLLAFAQVTHQIATERDLERADHAETRTLARNLEADNKRLRALLVESETVRRGQGGELEVLRAGAAPLRDGPRPHLGPAVRCWCDVTHGHGQTTALNAPKGRDRIEANP